MAQDRSEALGYPRGFWQVLAAPGVLWLLVLFVLPLYGVLSVAMGTRDPIFFAPVPVWNPVRWQLAHMFIDYLYDTDQSLLDYSCEGFQPPITPLDPSRAISDGYIPPSLENVIVRDVDGRNGYQVLELPPDADAMWQDAWALVKAGV